MTREDAIFAMEYYKLHFALTRKAIEAFDMAINALEQEPCEDAISRQAMHIELEKWITYGEYKYSNATKCLYDRIDRLSPVTPAEKVGQWIDTDNYYQRWKCSECGCHTRDARPNYCSNCGAKMQEVEE